MSYMFDLLILGGGPGGLAAAKTAAELGKKVALCDFFLEFEGGNNSSNKKRKKVGLGGTCVNFGCIPKKMFHFAGNINEEAKKMELFSPSSLSWSSLREKVDLNIKAINFSHRSSLRALGVSFFNKYAKIRDKNTVELFDPPKKKKKNNIENNIENNSNNNNNIINTNTLKKEEKLKKEENENLNIKQVSENLNIKEHLNIKKNLKEDLNIKKNIKENIKEDLNIKQHSKILKDSSKTSLLSSSCLSSSETFLTAKFILISCGVRPHIPEFEGNEFGITNESLFSVSSFPSSSVIVGGGFVAVEVASFMKSLGSSVTLMYRSVLLREFDREMVARVEKGLRSQGIRFYPRCIPEKLVRKEEEESIGNDNNISEEKKEGKKIICYYKDLTTNETKSEEFDMVLLAVGREANCSLFDLEKAGVKVNEKNGKIIVDEYDRTNVDNIFAIGDIADGRPELAPTAIKAGKLLAERLFGGSTKKVDYKNVPTTVYTRVEYGFCGMSEEKAIEKLGKENVKVYHSEFKPVEWAFDNESDETCFIKVIVNKKDNERVVGFHIYSPNAGEIIQGMAVAMNCGVTKEQLDDTIGVHPTVAEEMTTLTNVKGESEAKKTSC